MPVNPAVKTPKKSLRANQRLFPVFLDVENRDCLIVGAGTVALRKLTSLLECGAKVTVIAPQTKVALPEGVLFKKREFRDSDIDGFFMVVAATSSRELNHHIALLAKDSGCMVNDVSSAENSNMVLPAVLRRGEHVAVAVSTSGASPALAKHLRDIISQVILDVHGKVATVLAQRRKNFKASEDDVKNLIENLKRQ